MGEYTAYRSPLRLLTQFGLDPVEMSLENLALKKKELLLEIQLNPDQLIEIKGAKFTKNDVIQNFEEIATLTDLSFHQKIAENTELFNFLYDQTLPELGSIAHSLEFKNDEEFYEFRKKISPFMAYSFSRVMGSVISKVHYKRLMLLELLFDLLEAKDYHFAFKKLIRFNLDLQIKSHQQITPKSAFDWSEYQHLNSPELYDLANFVSRELFDFSENLAASLVNITAKYHLSPGRKDYLVRLSRLALNLECSQEIKKMLVGNLGIFRSSIEKEPFKEILPKLVKTWGVIAIIVVFTGIYATIYSPIRSKKNQALIENTSTSNSPATFHPIEKKSLKAFQTNLVNSIRSSQLSKNDLSKNNIPQFIIWPSTSATKVDLVYRRTLNLINTTSADAIFVMHEDGFAKSHFISANDSVTIMAGDFVSFFIYSGENWKQTYCVKSAQIKWNKDNTLSEKTIQFNGYFSKINNDNIVLLTKLFSWDKKSVNRITLSMINGVYELHEGDRFLNYTN